MKKLLVIAMVGMMLTGVGCKQADKVTEDVEKNTKQIEEYQEEKEKPVEEEKDSDEERYAKAEEFIDSTIEEQNTGDECEFIVTREQNCICIRMEVNMEGYSLAQAYNVYGYTKQEVYEFLGFDVMLESMRIFANTAQSETRRQYGNDINVVVDTYFGEDRIYCVDGDGEVMFNYFDEQ